MNNIYLTVFTLSMIGLPFASSNINAAVSESTEIARGGGHGGGGHGGDFGGRGHWDGHGDGWRHDGRGDHGWYGGYGVGVWGGGDYYPGYDNYNSGFCYYDENGNYICN